MLTVIQPSLRKKHFRLLSKIFETREGFYDTDKDPFDTPHTIYIAYSKDKLGAFGSARLNLLEDSLAAPYYADNFPPERIRNGLEISLVSFRMEDHWAKEYTAIFDTLIRNFHQSIHQLAADICESQGFGEIMSLSFEDDHPDLVSFGGWQFSKTHSFSRENSSFIIGELPINPFHEHSPLKGAA